MRVRKCCPECDTVRVHRRQSTQDYICESCGWVGSTPNTTTRYVSFKSTPLEMEAKMKKVRAIHEAHPEYTKKELRMVAIESQYLIDKYWKQFKMMQTDQVNTSSHSGRVSSIHSVSTGLNSPS